MTKHDETGFFELRTRRSGVRIFSGVPSKNPVIVAITGFFVFLNLYWFVLRYRMHTLHYISSSVTEQLPVSGRVLGLEFWYSSFWNSQNIKRKCQISNEN